jgi:hypothetical protein
VTFTASGFERPDLAHVPDHVWPPHRETTGVVVEFDLRLGGRYVTAECQLGAHHACPGGLFTEGRTPDLRCRCVADGCSCKPRQEPTR